MIYIKAFFCLISDWLCDLKERYQECVEMLRDDCLSEREREIKRLYKIIEGYTTGIEVVYEKIEELKNEQTSQENQC